MTEQCTRRSADEKMELNLRRSQVDIRRYVIMFLLALNITTTESSDNKTDNKDNDELDISKRLKLLDNLSGRSFNDLYENGTFRTGSELWDNILNKCSLEPSVNCLQNNVYSYLDNSLDYGEVNFSGVSFIKNNVDLHKYSKEANEIYLNGNKEKADEKRSFEEENEIKDDEESESPLEAVTDALYNKVNKFLVTHDLKLTLPEYFFHGATLNISPRALTKTGALVHIDLKPKETSEEGRFHIIKKIKQHLRKKLVLAFLGIILVVKLIVLKLIFVLPVITGITTAKKLFLKVLLFLFPALSHIFKLCSWYHQNYHSTKYHHHHHLITHHHKPPPAPVYGPPSHGYGGHGGGHGAFTVIKPPAEGAPVYEPYPQDWELSGPGLGPEYLSSDIHRNAIANFKPNIDDASDINSWGLGLPPGPSSNTGEYFSANNNAANAVPSFVATQKLAAVPKRPVGPPNPYTRNKKTTTKDPLEAEKEALIRAAALAARVPASPVRDEILRVSALKLSETNRVKTETALVKQQQQILAASDPETIEAEKFYSPLLHKVNEILKPLGASDPECRERAICALYKDPFKHAPYSNLVSNELSKNSNELPPVAESKSAIMYYRYVQAARDGQEEKDCAVTYPDCNIDFKKKK